MYRANIVSIKEIYNRTTNGGFSKAEDPQGTPQRASQQIPQGTPRTTNGGRSDAKAPQGTSQRDSQQIPQRTSAEDENIYSEIQEEENFPLDLTKTGMVCFHFHQNWIVGQFRGHTTAVYKI